MNSIYGYVNGQPVFSRDEFVFKSRRFGEIKTDEELIAFAEKVTGHWSQAGWCRTFTGYYLGNYALDEPYNSLTKTEYARLKELQAAAIAEEERIETEKEWRLINTLYYADNSIEEVYENKYGERKTVMAVQPHGDAY